jgi:beta-fructofuranosidase
VFFRPQNGCVGDVIPHVVDGEVWLYYLHDPRDARRGMGWSLARTRDFVSFDDDGVALPSGDPAALDFNAYTGSVVVDSDVAHLFYTGQNPNVVAEDGVTPLQRVMHAVSKDGSRTWEKDDGFSIAAPAGYEPGDWRDPFVFRPHAGQPWRMLITARHDTGPERRRGVIAQYVSDDLLSWQLTSPFWDPGRYEAHECPEVFHWAGWWYLVYSEFSERFSTRYRMARDVNGPWLVPEHDSLDGRAFYAAKSLELRDRRFFMGWIATKENARDDGCWEWAGDLSVLEATQRVDGTLAFEIPAELRDSFYREQPLCLVTTRGPVTRWTAGAGTPLQLTARDGYIAAASETELPRQYRATVVVTIDEDTTECGVVLRATADADQGYQLRLEPRRGRMVFDRWPRRRTGPMQWEHSGDVPYLVELERPCHLTPGTHVIDLLVDGSAMVATLDNAVALSARLYDHPAGGLAVFVGEGSATFHNVTVSTRD